MKVNGSSACVLVVDDFEQWRRLVRADLEKEGLHVIGEAADGPEALQKAEDLQPDLIVLDIGLPTLNGMEVVRKIRRVSPKSKVVFLHPKSVRRFCRSGPPRTRKRLCRKSSSFEGRVGFGAQLRHAARDAE